MINTIFWFVDTEQEYRDAIENGDVSSKTIVFVGETREIYLNGKGYGKTSTAGLLPSSEFDAWKEQIQNTIQRLDNAISTSSELDRELINNLESELEEAAQNLRTQIEAVNTNTNSISERLTRFQNTVGNEISQSINDAITDSNGKTIWSKIAETDESIDAVVNRLNTSIDENGNIKYTSALQSTIDTGINNNTAFTNIKDNYAVLDENQDVIEWMTSGFKSQADPNTTFASVYSSAQQANSSAIGGLTTRIGNIEGDYLTSETDITSLVTTALNDEDTVNSLSYVATKSDVAGAESRLGARIDNIDGLSENVAEISAKVDKNSAVISELATVGDSGVITWNESTFDDAVSSTLVQHGGEDTASMSLVKQMANAAAANYDITTKVQNAVSGMSLASQSDVDELNIAKTNIIAAIKDPNSDNLISSSSIQQIANDNAAKLNALVSWSGNTPTGDVKHTAGLITEAGLDDAIAALSANSESKFAKYMAGFYAETDDDGAIAQMIADAIDSDTGGVKTAIIEVAAGMDMSKITLSAELIYLDADRTLANTIEATQGTIGGITISDNNMHSSNNKFSVTSDGKLTAADAIITGEINATKITITNNTVIDGQIDNSHITGFDTLQSDVTTANTNASNALSTATTAAGNASDAISTANTAATNASDAISAANSASSTANSAISKANSSVKDTQRIYRTAPIETMTMEAPVEWISDVTGGNNKWTSVRPEYNSTYKTLFTALQYKKVDDSISCTTPVIDKTTTVIDGGNITTGKIAAQRIDADNLQVKAANITGQLIASQINTTGLVADSINSNTIVSNELNVTSGLIGGFNINSDNISSGGLFLQSQTGSSDSSIGTTKDVFVGDVLSKSIHSGVSPDGFRTSSLDISTRTILTTNEINSDGSGFLASENFKWDTNGDIEIKGSDTYSKLVIKEGNFALYSVEDDAETGTLSLNYDGIVADAHGSNYAKLTGNGLTVDGGLIKQISGDIELYDSASSAESNDPGVVLDGTSICVYDPNNHNPVVYINDSGTVTANSFVKTGGTSSQFLKADGSVDSNTYAVESTIKSYIDQRIMDAVNLILGELHSGYSLGKRGNDFEIERAVPGGPELGGEVYNP